MSTAIILVPEDCVVEGAFTNLSLGYQTNGQVED